MKGGGKWGLGTPLSTPSLESQTSINKLEAPSAYQRSSKMHENIEKINFLKTVFVSISINIYTYRNKHCLYKIDCLSEGTVSGSGTGPLVYGSGTGPLHTDSRSPVTDPEPLL